MPTFRSVSLFETSVAPIGCSQFQEHLASTNPAATMATATSVNKIEPTLRRQNSLSQLMTNQKLGSYPQFPQPGHQVVLRPVTLDPVAVSAQQLKVLDVVPGHRRHAE